MLFLADEATAGLGDEYAAPLKTDPAIRCHERLSGQARVKDQDI
jgi:hypothetical protein